jgi:hypothetical protein
MIRTQRREVVRELIENALREIADLEFQERVWIKGSISEMSSMNEATCSLFNDSNLDEALEKNQIVFNLETDNQLRNLQKMLNVSLKKQQEMGTAAVIHSTEWNEIRDVASRIFELLSANRGGSID